MEKKATHPRLLQAIEPIKAWTYCASCSSSHSVLCKAKRWHHDRETLHCIRRLGAAFRAHALRPRAHGRTPNRVVEQATRMLSAWPKRGLFALFLESRRTAAALTSSSQPVKTPPRDLRRMMKNHSGTHPFRNPKRGLGAADPCTAMWSRRARGCEPNP